MGHGTNLLDFAGIRIMMHDSLISLFTTAISIVNETRQSLTKVCALYGVLSGF